MFSATYSRGLRTLARGVSLLGCIAALGVAAAPAVAQAQTLKWEPSGALFWSVNRTTILGVFQNGACTEWAANKRPDVVRAIIEGFVSSELAHSSTHETMPNMDARYWAAEAALVGIPTGHKPQRGALIVIQPGVLRAGSRGHIAYVRGVNRNGSFRISAMNAPVPYHVTRVTFPAAAGRLSGVSFVY